jgi:hypothetical protein
MKNILFLIRFNWGDGAQVLTIKPPNPGSLTDNKSWHKASIIRSGEDTTLVVGQLPRETHHPMPSMPRPEDPVEDKVSAVTTRSFGRRKDNLSVRDALSFGNSTTNSYVFVGGLPFWYNEKIDSVVLATVMLEPRYRGAIRKLKYKDTRSDQFKIQDMMAYKVSQMNDNFTY